MPPSPLSPFSPLSPRSSPPAPGDDPAELAARLRLAYTHGIGPARGRALLERFGSAAAAFEAGPAEIARTLGSAALTTALCADDAARQAAIDHTLRWRDSAADRRILALGHPAYPERLLDLADPPLILHVEGRAELLDRPQIAIVGSRQASAAGLDTAHGLAASLADRGFVVTSGLAEGIDGAAHRGALAGGGLTVAALGTGIDRIYPNRHRALAGSIRPRGALLTELAPGTAALAANFPRRNRLIAALARAVVVVEAALSSGSLITARLAADLGRDVLAVPGSIHSPRARGCHRLLRDGAGLVETVDDVLSAVGAGLVAEAASHGGSAPARWERVDPSEPAGPDGRRGPDTRPGPPAGDADACRLLELLAADPVHIDRLAGHLDRPVGSTLALAQRLELDGWVRRLDDGRFVRC